MTRYEIQYQGPSIWMLLEYTWDNTYPLTFYCYSFEQAMQLIWDRTGKFPVIKVELHDLY